MQTICGHLFCQSCIDIILGSPDSKCPEDQEKLIRNEVFQDAFTRRELKMIELHCPSEKCQWFGIYEKLEGHYQVCEHALISCIHKQCNIQLPRFLLGEHLKNDCEYRNVKCEYCGRDVPHASLKDDVEKFCENAPVVCKYCKKKIPRKHIENHEKTTCDEVPTECEFQTIGCNYDKTIKRKEIRQHMKDNIIDHVSLLLRYAMAFVTQLSNYVPRPEFTTAIQNMADQVTAVRANLSEKFVMLVGKLKCLERRIESIESRGGNDSNPQMSSEISLMRDRISTLERQLRDNSSTILRFRERLDQIDQSLRRNTVKITDLEAQRGSRVLGSNQSIHSYNGTLLWKIDNFSKKRQDAINGIKTALYSPPFYSSQYGYKMCAKIYINGDDPKQEAQLSLFFVVMKGDYDALQTWPFQKKITMMLMDQENGDHMSLNNPQDIKDDTIFIKLIVD